jgi:hypothetical protein
MYTSMSCTITKVFVVLLYFFVYFTTPTLSELCWGSSVGIAVVYGLDDQEIGVRVPVGSRMFSSTNHPDRLWVIPSLLSNGYWELFPRR